MNKSILRQALKFKDNNPFHSQIEKLYSLALEYQKNEECYFIKSKYRQKAEILDYEMFFKFISEELLSGKKVLGFEDIENIIKATTRKENIQATGNSKSNYIRVFDKVIIYQIGNNSPSLHKNIHEIEPISKILAVENGETFLNIYLIMSKFGFNEFVYLGGFTNTLTREFLVDKDVVFFLDYDIEAIRIYDSFKCKKKSFFKHPNIEKYFNNKKIRNTELYLEQRDKLPEQHSELQWLIDLIEDSSAVIEQEIIEYEAY
ncbi:hypothetical protein [Sulfurimonas sp.]|uniref:hypothetical protein n=1 Tax=Sulfurimonas sp. TaxID=2022749 RepID=UPI0025E1DC6F|nr:hypothetical protein [Sulfurimonas sp.]